MKHRERVEMALNHERPDRCPMQVSFTPEFAERLAADMGIDQQAIPTILTGAETPTPWNVRWAKICC